MSIDNTLDVKAILERHANLQNPRNEIPLGYGLAAHSDRGALLKELDRLTSELERAREALDTVQRTLRMAREGYIALGSDTTAPRVQLIDKALRATILNQQVNHADQG